MNLKEIITYIAIIISAIALIVSTTALIVGIKNYRRKSGIYIKGSFSITTSAYAEDAYISSITLENSKDRAVIIFKIFLKLGNNYYIEIDDFEHEPKILKPYESYTKSYEPVDFYCLNMHRVNFNKMLSSRKRKAKIVLSTSQGKYLVSENINQWDPVFHFFRNHMTAYVIPMRPNEKVGYYGSNFKYLVKLHTSDGYVNSIPVYADSYHYPRFDNFMLTPEALSSRDSLEIFLTDQAVNGNLKCVNLEVIDAETIRSKNYHHDFGEAYEAVYYNKLQYFVLGRLLTIWSNCALRFENYKNRKKS